MALFNAKIENWSDWGKVFRSIPDFAPLAAEIFRREGLAPQPLESLTPGTNAVFKSGENVIKIFCPAESGLDGSADMATEVFATNFAHDLGVNCPKILATGEIIDTYRFAYMIMSFESGIEFGKAVLNSTEKRRFGADLRALTDKMNVNCPDFNHIDPICDPHRWERWDSYPESFKIDRERWINAQNWGEFVFVHGDLNPDNILLDPATRTIKILDFADSVKAPLCYEQALVASELFRFDSDLLAGYFGEYDTNSLAELILAGLLIHDFGGDVVAQRICHPEELRSVDDLRRKILEKLR